MGFWGVTFRLSLEPGISSQLLKRKGRQGDSPGVHWEHWKHASTSQVNTKAVTLTTFPFLGVRQT